MLRFERKSRNQEVSISLRNPDKFINRLSMVAFGIALGLHFLGVLIFHIAPFKIQTAAVLPPVAVKAETPAGPYVAIENTAESPLNISKPPFSKPELPPFPTRQNFSFDPGEL